MGSYQPDHVEVFPPYGFLRLVEWHGDELSIVNAARVSFHKESEYIKGDLDALTEFPKLKEDDEGLIKYLLTHRHGSPFEQGFQSTWHIRMPIFVMREWVRHRIGHSVNEESGRYTEMRPDFYIPEQARSQMGKPGAYVFEFEEADSARSRFLQESVYNHSRTAFDLYKRLLDDGYAKEQARIVLPLNLYTEIRWTANARSLMHFLGLRNDPPAMFEIKSYAKALEDIFARYMPTTHKAFVENGRVAP